MASLNPIQTVFDAVGGALGATQKARDLYSDYRRINTANDYALKTYQQAERDLAEKAGLEQRRLLEETAEETRKRQQALKRAMATQQARYGAQGIDASDGSGQAVMLGLFQESAEEKAYRDRLNKIREDSLKQDVESKKQRNLLSLRNTYDTNRNSFIANIDRYF